jgi:hypothetical protein
MNLIFQKINQSSEDWHFIEQFVIRYLITNHFTSSQLINFKSSFKYFYTVIYFIIQYKHF